MIRTMTGLVPNERSTSVGIGAMAVSADRSATLVTHALGSCIGVLLYEPTQRVGGLLHFQLPTAPEGPLPPNPALYGDTGIDLLVMRVRRMVTNVKRCRVHVVGGAQMLSGATSTDIGRRNYAVARRALWKHGLLVSAEDVGGKVSRTVRLFMESGAVEVHAGTGGVRRL